MQPNLKEADFQRLVIDYAHLNRWRVAHFRASLNQRGKWQTAIAGDAKGFPDLVLVRDRVIFAELKTDRGVISDAQKQWRDWLKTAGAEHHVWRPRDWTDIERILGASPF
jgi:hypothetical protein